MSSLPLADITIDRPARQRKELRDVPALAASISRIGLIHPILVSRSDNLLVAGERRLAACRSLGWTSIPVTFTDEVDPTVLHLIEIEENAKRLDLHWRDHNAAVAQYHKLARSADPAWTQTQSAEALGMSQENLNQHLSIAAEIARGNTMVSDAQGFSVARVLTERAAERRRAAERDALEANVVASVQSAGGTARSTVGSATAIAAVPAPAAAPPAPFSPILHADFHEWVAAYSGPRFNLIHCDFPYGIDADKRQQGSSVGKHGGYADSEDVYWQLCHRLAGAVESGRLAAPECHFIFWFSMKFYQQTLTFFAKEMPSVDFDPFPLVWHKSDNVGLLPDPSRGPRRTYEVALFGVRGDRKVVRAKANSFSGPTVRDDHMSVKPVSMLRHFFEMLIDEHTSFLDPTCGLGSSVRAAAILGAHNYVGLERDAEFAWRAQEAFKGGTES